MKYPHEAPKNSEELWKIHKRLAVYLANRFHKRYPNVLPLEDKISYAYLAMLNCLANWDSNRKNSFSTYLYEAIRRKLQREINRELCAISPGPINAPGKYNTRVGSLDDTVIQSVFAEPQVEELVEFKERIAFIKKKLPIRYHKAFDLMINDGMGLNKAAKATEVSNESMRKRLDRVLQDLHTVCGD